MSIVCRSGLTFQSLLTKVKDPLPVEKHAPFVILEDFFVFVKIISDH